DLADKGAGAFAAVIRQVRKQAPECRVEVLTPDFQGQEMPLARVIAERPDVFNHNVEVVPRLYPVARRGSEFERSCRVLAVARAWPSRAAARGRAHEVADVFPLKDNIPNERIPFVTIALIVINVIAYLLSIRHGGSFINGPSSTTAVPYGAIPYELTHYGN